VPCGGDVGGRSTLAEQLLDGVSWDEVDEEEDEADDQPDDWEGVEDALEEGFQFSVLSSQAAFVVGLPWRLTPHRLSRDPSTARDAQDDRTQNLVL
jgi:hypothetical protein